MPLDETCAPCALMALMPAHVEAGWKVPIWDEYKALATAAEGRSVEFEEVSGRLIWGAL